ncbi:MAG: cupredoxin domain-containing protein [Actinomycetota bacterium]|nr:cupredoxin domain-containing protein [Actinomycetota bacterium]
MEQFEVRRLCGGGLMDAGSYPFHCSMHPKITGTMIVV